MPGSVLVTAFGESRTVSAWARDARCSVSAQTVRNRLNNGWPAERAIASPAGPPGPPPETLEAFGETKTLVQWTEDPRFQVTADALRHRLRSGWSLERALSTPVRAETVLEAFGETKTVAQWADDPRCRVSVQTVHDRLGKGWPPERALSTPGSGRIVEAFGETKTVAQWADDPRCVVSEGTLRKRLRSGWSPQLAMSTPSGG